MRTLPATPGFTVIEALLALLIAALLLGTAIPAWSAAREAAHAAEARTRLQSSLDVAIRHATVTGSEVVMCPGDGHGDTCHDSFDWSGGWIAWADVDGDRRRDPVETLLRKETALPGEVHLRSTTGRRRLVLQPHGGAASGTNATFTLCDGRGTSKAVALVLANSGRLRRARPAAASARACM
ncbi:MAG: GspH/FimT family protein, partial [Pseudomonadota bacterium]|nr:GspH/FimT family protein [Pseudomonadota bacterium]